VPDPKDKPPQDASLNLVANFVGMRTPTAPDGPATPEVPHAPRPAGPTALAPANDDDDGPDPDLEDPMQREHEAQIALMVQDYELTMARIIARQKAAKKGALSE